MIRSTLIAIAAVAVIGAVYANTAGGIAFAETAQGQAAAASGPDLSTVDGARAYYADIKHVAADICGGTPTYGGIEELERFDSCFRQAVAEAVAQTNAPRVTALHEAR
jgi:UrcA family protein